MIKQNKESQDIRNPVKKTPEGGFCAGQSAGFKFNRNYVERPAGN